MIQPFDENLHPVGPEKHWQESWYFNWADPRHRVLGVTRIGFRFAANEIDGLVFTIRNGRPEFAYPAINAVPTRPWDQFSPADGIGVRRLRYRMIEPLKHWRLELSGKDSIELEWQAFTPAYDYAAGGEAPPEIANAHFEQSGRVLGRTHLHGKTLQINGYGQRDKSWGVRDWSTIVGWTWISAQFGEDYSFNAWFAPRAVGPVKRFGKRKIDAAKPYQNGFVHIDGVNHPIERIEIDWRWGARPNQPAGARLRLHTRGGRHDFDIACQGVFPLAKSGMWLYELYATVQGRLHGIDRTGIGIVEHAFHVGRLGYLRRAGEIAGTLKSVFGAQPPEPREPAGV